MRTHQLADLLAEAQLPQVLLAEQLLAHATDTGSVFGRDHSGHLSLGRGKEAADIVEEGTQDGLVVRTGLLGQLSGLQRVFQLRDLFARVVSAALQGDELEQFRGSGARVLFDGRQHLLSCHFWKNRIYGMSI